MLPLMQTCVLSTASFISKSSVLSERLQSPKSNSWQSSSIWVQFLTLWHLLSEHNALRFEAWKRTHLIWIATYQKFSREYCSKH